MLKPDDFRRIALGLTGAIESAHMGHPDFRANGRIFADEETIGEALTLAFQNTAKARSSRTPRPRRASSLAGRPRGLRE